MRLISKPYVAQVCLGLIFAWHASDLLQQNEIYLETNQIALASEKLAFTVNARGYARLAGAPS
jgi:hypothetical protein